MVKVTTEERIVVFFSISTTTPASPKVLAGTLMVGILVSAKAFQ
jgi:hypothetical protein